MTIQIQKHYEARKSRSLVSISKWMIAEKSPGESSTKDCHRTLIAKVHKVSRMSDRRFQRIVVSNSGDSAVTFDDPTLNISQYVSPNELEAHFANSR
jgi:two-component SAPR family response regulator